jgi:tetratricopeptide (TPR) repeat protein
MKFILSGLVLLVAILGRSEAAADTPPSVWDRARDPAEGDRWKIHVTVERLLHPPRSDGVLSLEQDRRDELSLQEARVALEEADASHGPDGRLAFDLGIVYEHLAALLHDSGLDEEAARVLSPALAAFPDHPGAVRALSALAFALARLDRPQDELEAWQRYLPKLADDNERLTPMMNMGEAEMRVGRLDQALATFRSALDLCQSLPNSASLSEAYALLLWDVGITLDRQGDLAGALRTAGEARAFSWTINRKVVDRETGAIVWRQVEETGWDVIQDQETVFFVPNWEREWYLALGDAALASRSTDARLAAKTWAEAEGHWGTYLARATEARRAEGARPGGGRQPAVDRWAAIARSRRDRAHRARLAAEKRAVAVTAPTSLREPL